MDMRKYTDSPFLKADDLRDGPIEATIAGIEQGRYGKPNISFEDGTRLSVNVTNSRNLAKAYGFNSDNWIDKRIELYLGSTTYDGKPQETVLVEPVSPSANALPKQTSPQRPLSAPKAKPTTGGDGSGDLDDDISFGPEVR